MARDPKLELLKSIPLFSRLGRKDIERLSQLVDEIDVPGGHVLMRQGDRGSEMFVLESGRVRVERDGHVLAERGPGEVLGEIALLSEGPRTATVTTVDPARLFVVAHREFHALMDEMPSVRLAVLEALAERIRILEADQAH